MGVLGPTSLKISMLSENNICIVKQIVQGTQKYCIEILVGQAVMDQDSQNIVLVINFSYLSWTPDLDVRDILEGRKKSNVISS